MGKKRIRYSDSPVVRNLYLQCVRRHNERDGRLIYCDYCDLFICSIRRVWEQHLNSCRHMDSVEAYYAFLEVRDSSLLTRIREDVSRAHLELHVMRYQKIAGKGSSVPLEPVVAGCVGNQTIVVGGVVKPQRAVVEYPAVSCTTTPSVRVGGVLVAGGVEPVVKVGSNIVTVLPSGDGGRK
uniref:Matrin-type domain-containing protein n=1 Tax=Trypanosoma congolense (strain IL3000) TaxID=1068625 RepID=G0UVK0_TRYCI|nr:conserved hypothetical protein [Trypanosoma congolense IL3000]